MDVLAKLRKMRAAQRRADRKRRAIERRNLRRMYGDEAFPVLPTEARDAKAGQHSDSSSDSDGGEWAALSLLTIRHCPTCLQCLSNYPRGKLLGVPESTSLLALHSCFGAFTHASVCMHP